MSTYLIGFIVALIALPAAGFLIGRHQIRSELERERADYRRLVSNQRVAMNNLRNDLENSRINAAQALEAATLERDQQEERATTYKLRLTTAQERIEQLEKTTLTPSDAEALAAMASILKLAATQFRLLSATVKEAEALQLAAKASALHERYSTAQPILQERAA